MYHHARAAALTLATLLLLALPAAASAQDGSSKATVSIATQDHIASGAADIPVNVNVTGASDLAGFQFVLSFDSSMLQYVSVDQTDFLGKTGRQIQCADPTVDHAAVRFTCVTLRLQPSGVAGDGTLAVVHLKSVKSGTSPIRLSTVKLVHPDGSELPSASVNGSLVVSGNSSGFPWWAIAVAAGAVVVVVAAVALIWRRRSSSVTGGGPGPYAPDGSTGS